MSLILNVKNFFPPDDKLRRVKDPEITNLKILAGF